MTLRQKQTLFATLLVELIEHMFDSGYEVTIGEVYRSPEEAERLAKLGKGIRNSLHTIKLAADINLFKNGQYLSSTESHRAMGEWWEKQHPLCRWGGRFNDGNHYSLEHGGRR